MIPRLCEPATCSFQPSPLGSVDLLHPQGLFYCPGIDFCVTTLFTCPHRHLLRPVSLCLFKNDNPPASAIKRKQTHSTRYVRHNSTILRARLSHLSLGPGLAAGSPLEDCRDISYFPWIGVELLESKGRCISLSFSLHRVGYATWTCQIA